MTSPPWLQASLATPRSAPESGLATLARPGGIVGIAGGAGSGKTALAASLARASGATVVAVRVAGCRTTEDARLAVGLAIGALPPGDPSEVASALRRLGSPIVVLDEVDDQRVAGVIEELGALAPEVRWLATGERDLWPAQTLRLAAPTAKGPSIEEALRGAGFDPPWSCLDQLTAEAQALACLPAGLKTDAIDVPEVLRVRLGPGRTALRRAAIAAMPAELLPEPSRAAARLAPLLESALGLAIGAPLPDDLGLPDLLALRWLTEMLMGPRDFAWFRHFGKYLSHQHDLPEAGKFNPGQKLFFWTAVGTTVGLLLSGLLLWFPGTWTAGWLSWARTVHAACFVLITVGFIYHLYLSTVAFPGTLRAMTRGTVSRAWARLHHAGWLKDQDGA